MPGNPFLKRGSINKIGLPIAEGEWNDVPDMTAPAQMPGAGLLESVKNSAPLGVPMLIGLGLVAWLAWRVARG